MDHMTTKPQEEDPGRSQRPEYIEGPEAFRRFDAMMTALVAVPKSVVEKREKAYRKKVDANPNRRGPKRKV
jgi:hypothetical protein